MINYLRKVWHCNIYLDEFYGRTRFGKQNKKLEKKIEELSSTDPILNFNEFKEKISQWKADPSYIESNHTIHTIKCHGSESLYYGHMNAIFDYANVDNKEGNLILPGIEHGMNWYEQLPINIENFPLHIYFTQGSYKNDIIHRLNPMIPVFNIGPYVHYASFCYSSEMIDELKKKLGKTLLVFPFHCYENSKASYDIDKFVYDIFNQYASGFDTVLVSAYWNDVEDPIYDKFTKCGAKVVSSGFRGDKMFISRLKTILFLSDVTLGNDLGTHIGYSVYMGKPHILVSDNEVSLSEKNKNLTVEEIQKYTSNLQKFKSEFSYEKFLEGETGEDTDQYIRFWGGSRCTKSREEIKAIIEISKDILSITHGFRTFNSAAVRQLLKKYRYKDEIKYKLLNQSISSTIKL